MNIKFPEIKKTIADLINDEEGNIPRKKLVTIGSTIMLMGIIMGFDYSYAAHSSHKSHSSHTSHSSTSYHRSHSSHSSHTSHSNWHSSHASHSDHGSHASHENTHSSHSNVNTGATHMNSVDVDLPGTMEIPVPQMPVANDLPATVQDVSSSVGVSLDVDKTQDPRLDKK